MGFLKNFFEFRQMKSLIKQATETIYSEQFDYEVALQRLEMKSDKLTALIAIKFAVYLDEPVSKDDIKQAIKEVHLSKIEFKEKEQMEGFLDSLKDDTEIDWLERTKSILEGKLAYKENEYSYEAAIYHLEKIKKGPSTAKEKEKWKTLSSNLEEAEKNYNDHVQKLMDVQDEEQSRKAAQAVLDKMIAERDERRKHMTDEEIQNEIAQAKIDRENILSDLKQQLKKSKENDN